MPRSGESHDRDVQQDTRKEKEQPVLRVGLIGVGDTAGWRARALRAAGLTITAVSSRPESQRVEAFAERHGIPRTFAGWREMLRSPELFDAIAIATWPDGTPEVLAAAIDLGVPILVEKPVGWSSASIAELIAMGHPRVLVGYNRRFYRSVQEARLEARQGPPALAHLSLPIDVVTPDEPTEDIEYMWPFYESVSALGLDLTRFVLGDLHVESVQHLRNPAGNLAGIAALLTTERGDVLQLSSAWSAAANYALTLDWPGRRCALAPFEMLSVYEGMEVHLPTAEYPIRRYLPKLVRQVVLDGIDLEEKPGFVAEARALRDLMGGREASEHAARLEDALAVTTLCEELTGVTLGASRTGAMR